MSQRKCHPSSSHKNQPQNDQTSLTQTSQDEEMSSRDGKNVAITRDGSIFVRTLVQVDPDSELFMKVAAKAYAEHEQSLVPCLKCSRKFFPDRIEIHQRNCAATKLQSPSSKLQQKHSRQN